MSPNLRRSRAVFFASLALPGWIGCGPAGSAGPVAPVPAAETKAPSVDAASAADAVKSSAPKAALSATEKDARIDAALARIPGIAASVSAIRHLPLKHPVPAAMQSQDDFRAYLQKEIARELPPEKSVASVRALVRLGLLKESVDLGKTVEDAMVSQAGAYYDPATKKFYLVLVPDDLSMLDVMSAHELTHALDDEYFDLAAYVESPTPALTNDQQQARRFVGEGEATLVMLAYQAKVAAHQDIFDPANRRLEQAMVAAFAALDSEQLAKSAADNPDLIAQMGPSMKASLDAMNAIPPFILDPLFGAYTKGAAAVAAVRDAGGWDAVSDLYKHPPESTEQLLHPQEKLITKRDHPVELTFAPVPKLFAGQTPLDSDVVGELTMAVYFKNWGDKTPTERVLGWGGDRYAAYVVGDKVVGVWLTTWDTAKDAERFQASYVASLPARFVMHGAHVEKTLTGATRGLVYDGVATLTRRVGKDVAIIDGAPEADAEPLFAWLAQTKHAQAK